LTFKIVCQKLNKEVPENIKEFISKFERNYENNLKGFQSYLSAICQISELEHLKHKLPQIPANLF
jgi:hypothetical protein